MMNLRFMIASACVVASPLAAENRALLLGTETYGEDTVTAAGDISAAADALEAAGFAVVSGVDLDIDALREELDSLVTDEAPERSVILLAGRFASSGGSSWYLTGQAEEPSLATIDGQALSLETVMEIAGRSPGGAVVLLGFGQALPDEAAEDVTFTLGTGLTLGLGMVEAPQGVTVILGEVSDILSFAEETLVTPGLTLPQMLEGTPGLEAHGFLSPLMSFLVDDDAAVAPDIAPAPPAEPSPEEVAAAAERDVWQAAQATDTVSAYEAYLNQYPDGAFAEEARAAIDALADDPEQMEAALELGSSQRQQIQRNLAILDHDPSGVDGVFGPGTRGAISNWQQANAFEATGFLTAEQIDILSETAATREAALEEEEVAQQLERELEDRAFWEDTGRGEDEAGLRAYLDRFPDGVFSDVATARLSDLVAARDAEAWESAQSEDTEAAYLRYLDEHEDGAFVDGARARLAEMDAVDALAADDAAAAELIEGAEDDAALEEQAREAEAALGLNVLTRSLVEAQLQVQGFSPGQIDGQFDGNTREALRGYQEARGLPVTGYVNRDTLDRMIADGLPLP